MAPISVTVFGQAGVIRERLVEAGIPGAAVVDSGFDSHDNKHLVTEVNLPNEKALKTFFGAVWSGSGTGELANSVQRRQR